MANGNVVYTLCSGDTCERKTLEAKLAVQPNVPAPDARLIVRLFTQPLSVGFTCGLLLLIFCVLDFVPPTVSEPLLGLVGGPSGGWFIVYAASAAHVLEGTFALVTCLRAPLSFSLGAACVWCAITTILGFTSLMHLLKLKAIASAP